MALFQRISARSRALRARIRALEKRFPPRPERLPMPRAKAPKSPDITHALGAALAASKLYAQTLDKLITCADKGDFKGAAELLKLGHEQVLALKDAHNNLYVPVNAAIKAAAPANAEKPPRETKRSAKAVKEAEPEMTEQSGDEP